MLTKKNGEVCQTRDVTAWAPTRSFATSRWPLWSGAVFQDRGGGSTPANHALPPATVGFNTGGDLSQKKSGIAGEIFAGFLKTARTNFVDFSKKQNWLEKIRGISFLAFFSFSK